MDLDEKLRSRLGGGLVVDFLPTNFEIKMNILNKKVNQIKLDIPYEVLEFLATQISNNIRELEGALNRICANYELTGREICVENSKELLSEPYIFYNGVLDYDAVLKQTGNNYGFNLNVRHVDGYSNERSINDLGLTYGYKNKVDSFLVFDFSARKLIKLNNGEMDLKFSIINIFDESAPRLYDAPDFSFDSRVHDPRGRIIGLNLEYRK